MVKAGVLQLDDPFADVASPSVTLCYLPSREDGARVDGRGPRHVPIMPLVGTVATPVAAPLPLLAHELSAALSAVLALGFVPPLNLATSQSACGLPFLVASMAAVGTGRALSATEAVVRSLGDEC